MIRSLSASGSMKQPLLCVRFPAGWITMSRGRARWLTPRSRPSMRRLRPKSPTYASTSVRNAPRDDSRLPDTLENRVAILPPERRAWVTAVAARTVPVAASTTQRRVASYGRSKSTIARRSTRPSSAWWRSSARRAACSAAGDGPVVGDGPVAGVGPGAGAAAAKQGHRRRKARTAQEGMRADWSGCGEVMSKSGRPKGGRGSESPWPYHGRRGRKSLSELFGAAWQTRCHRCGRRLTS